VTVDYSLIKEDDVIESSNDNAVLDIIHRRRSTRLFKEKNISDETLNSILQAGLRAPFAAQFCTIIYTRNKDIINELVELPYFGVWKTSNIVLFILFDRERFSKVIEYTGRTYNFDDSFALWLGLQEAGLIAGNMTIAAESLNIGSVLLGAVPVFPYIVKPLLGIPDNVHPIVGMCLGYPDEEKVPTLKPRFPLEMTAFEDKYHDLTAMEIEECRKVMNEGFKAGSYYEGIRGKLPIFDDKPDTDYSDYTWCEHISRKFGQGFPLSFVDILKDSGINFEKRM